MSQLFASGGQSVGASGIKVEVLDKLDCTESNGKRSDAGVPGEGEMKLSQDWR